MSGVVTTYLEREKRDLICLRLATRGSFPNHSILAVSRWVWFGVVNALGVGWLFGLAKCSVSIFAACYI